MTFTYDENIYSDLHKDAYGFRPRGGRFYADDATPEEKQAIWDALLVDLDAEIEREKEMRNEAVNRFEVLLTTMIASGAEDKATALRWLRQAENDEYLMHDDDYFEYTYNLPYGYLKGIA
jgi:hypothetical protein